MTNTNYIESSLIGKKYKPDMEFVYVLAIPDVEVEEYGLLVEHDGLNKGNHNSMIKLADEGKAPYCVSVGVIPGKLLLPDGSKREMRMNSYDFFDREYSDFLVYELIPHIIKEHGIRFSKSPDMHYVSGASSGGLSAFVIAWFHSDYFHRVCMCSPSFLAMGRGNEVPYLIRKYETKPLRIYEEYSENEPNDYFGWSRGVDEVASWALTFANYDFKCVYFENEGHSSRYYNEEEAYKRNEWIWRDWQNSSITAPDNSPRVNKVVPFTSTWERCEAFPKVERSLSEMLTKEYKNVVLSNDEKVWYVNNENEDIVYMYVDCNDMKIDKRLVHTMLHAIPRQNIKGAIDMAVDKEDRLFVLTEIGIQCVRSYGLIDVILNLPDDAQPQKIAIADALYVQTEKGVYKRTLCAECITDSEEKRKHICYFD